MKEKFKKLVHSRMTYAVLLSMLVVGVAAAGASSLTGGNQEGEDPYLALEETATPITYGDGSEGAEVAVVPGETVPDGAVADEETLDAYETVAEDDSVSVDDEETEVSAEPETSSREDDDEVSSEENDSEAASGEKSQGTADVTPSDVTSFSEADSLSWPVEGEIIRGFSMDTTVYYSTLDAYKVSPSVLIQGEPDMPVSAAAAGIVKEIGTDAEIGNYVVVELGNEYELTYGQLKDISVTEGELIDAGDTVATLAEPTKYYVREGCNLYFMMTKDGAAVDPLDYLQ